MLHNQISSENISFRFLRGSSDFLTALLDNLSECILLFDKQMRLQAFNDSLRTLFSNKPDEHLLFKRCGEALGCACHIEEGKPCGETSKCCDCEIRRTAILAYAEHVSIHKKRISKEFYRRENVKELRHLQFSVRSVRFQGVHYLFVLVEDITHLTDAVEASRQQQAIIESLEAKLAELSD